MLTKALIDTIEPLVDRHGLPAILNALADMCSAKADHLLCNWQDTQSAQWWVARSKTFETLAAKPYMRDA
jgi:hypothetical protein